MTTGERGDRLNHARILMKEIDGELEQRHDPKTVLEQMQKSAIADLRAEVAKLAKLLDTPRHRLVFIGQVGVGKTTAICHLVGLTADRTKKNPSKRGAETIQVTEDMMATGSGFTTLCEVVVTPADINRFDIDPYPPTEVERTITEFCQSVWKRAYPDEDSEQKTGGVSEQVNFPPELVRAVRNMVNLPGEGAKREDDSAIRLALEFPVSGFEQFRSQVLSKANIESRTQTEFVCPKEESEPRAWIKKTFDDLNLARLDTVSIPRRIKLYVDSTLLSAHMNRVADVVDTKGVDLAQFNREDLDRFIREDDTALCILTEGFVTAPTNVIQLLQRHVTKEAPLSLSKFVLMVIPRGSEPEKVVGGEGPVEDRESGIEFRRSQIEETISSQGLPRLEDRILFFDPLQHFESVKRDYQRRPDSEPSEIEADRDAAWAAISHAIEMREDQVWRRVGQIKESLKKIREGKGLNPEEENLVLQAKSKIAAYGHINVGNADRFLELFRALWGPNARHHMTLRATNNRFGVYPHRNIDIYYDAIPITEQLVRTATSGTKEAVLEIIRNVRSCSPERSDLRELFSVLEKRIDSSFEEMVRAVGVTMHDYLSSTAFHPRDQSNQFWIGVQSRYGKGGGFRDDVLSMYADQMEGHEGVLANAADEGWRTLLIDPIIQYLG